MGYSFPSMGLTNSTNMAYFWSIVTWAMGQAAPWIMMLFAATLGGMVIGMIYRAIHPAEDPTPYEEDK